MYRLIVVDDSRATQSIIRRALLAGGFSAEEVHAASTGAEALELAATLHPHLVITDWHMPGMSGLELLTKLRQTGSELVRVGMVTTETSEIRLSEARSLGVSFVVHKPFKDDELLKSVRHALEAPVVVATPRADSEPPPSSLILSAANAVTRQTHWKIAPTKLIDFESCTRKVLLGVYSRTKDNAVIGLGLMDADLVTSLGGLAAQLTVPEIQNALASHTPPDAALPQSEHFLTMLAGAIDPTHGTTLTRSFLVSVKLDLLRKTLHNNRWGAAFTLTMPGLSAGSLGLIRLGTSD